MRKTRRRNKFVTGKQLLEAAILATVMFVCTLLVLIGGNLHERSSENINEQSSVLELPSTHQTSDSQTHEEIIMSMDELIARAELEIEIEIEIEYKFDTELEPETELDFDN